MLVAGGGRLGNRRSVAGQRHRRLVHVGLGGAPSTGAPAAGRCAGGTGPRHGRHAGRRTTRAALDRFAAGRCLGNRPTTRLSVRTWPGVAFRRTRNASRVQMVRRGTTRAGGCAGRPADRATRRGRARHRTDRHTGDRAVRRTGDRAGHRPTEERRAAGRTGPTGRSGPSRHSGSPMRCGASSRDGPPSRTGSASRGSPTGRTGSASRGEATGLMRAASRAGERRAWPGAVHRAGAGRFGGCRARRGRRVGTSGTSEIRLRTRVSGRPWDRPRRRPRRARGRVGAARKRTDTAGGRRAGTIRAGWHRRARWHWTGWHRRAGPRGRCLRCGWRAVGTETTALLLGRAQIVDPAEVLAAFRFLRDGLGLVAAPAAVLGTPLVLAVLRSLRTRRSHC